MSRDTKIILAIVAGLVMIGVCVCVAIVLMLRSAGDKIGGMIKTDPTEVAQVAAGIATYDLPDNYKQAAFDLLGIYKAIILSREGDARAPMIMMMAIPTSTQVNSEDLRRAMEQNMQQRTGSGSVQWETVEEKTVQIRGEETQLVISEGTSSSGNRLRSMIGIFTGARYPVILMIMGDVERWDQETIDTFIQSIR